MDAQQLVEGGGGINECCAGGITVLYWWLSVSLEFMQQGFPGFHKMCVLIFSITSVRNISHSKKHYYKLLLLELLQMIEKDRQGFDLRYFYNKAELTVHRRIRHANPEGE